MNCPIYIRSATKPSIGFSFLGSHTTALRHFLERYEVLFKALFAIVYGLEKLQIDRGIGMTGRGNVSSEAQVWSEVRQKIVGGSVHERIACAFFLEGAFANRFVAGLPCR
jgi:hypothetical protein